MSGRCRKVALALAGAFALLVMTSCQPDSADLLCTQTMGTSNMYGPNTGSLPELPSPITAEQITALRQAFAWSDTSPLEELNAEGLPALRYVMFLIPSLGAEDLLTYAHVYHDGMPFFEEEWGPWSGQSGYVNLETDDASAAIWAILPAEAYNLIRAEALVGNEAFGPVLLLDAPVAEATAADGSLSYPYLDERGFTYGATEEEIFDDQFMAEFMVDEASDSTSSVEKRRRRFRRFLRRGIVRRLVRSVARIVGGVIRGLRRLGALFRLKRQMNVQFDVGNVAETYFDDATGQIVRAWGSSLGRRIGFDRAKIDVRTGFGITPIRLNQLGAGGARVPRDRRYGFVIHLNNSKVRITGGAGLWDRRLILDGLGGRRWHAPNRRGPVMVNMSSPMTDRTLNIFTTITDAGRFAHDVLGIHMIKATIDVPNDRAAKRQSGVAFTPCFSVLAEFAPHTLSTFTSGIASAGFVEFDIRMSGASGLSREVPVHEYGHWLECQMIRRNSYQRLPGIMDRVFAQAALGLDDQGIVHEAFADFFDSQASGGVDYFLLNAARRQVVGLAQGYSSTSTGFYCDDTAVMSTGPCLDDNIGGPTPLTMGLSPQNTRLARYVTTWTDAVDGQLVPPPVSGPEYASNGTSYSFSPTTGSYSTVWGADGMDENVVMPGSFVRDVWRRWGNGRSPGAGGRYDPGHFRDAMAGVMRDASVPEGDICNLFALHESASACYSAIASPLFASTVPPAAPVGLTAHLTPVLGAPSILAHWYDVSTASDGYAVRVTFDSSVLAEEIVAPAAPSTNFVLSLPGDLDLTAGRLELEVVTMNGTERSAAVLVEVAP